MRASNGNELEYTGTASSFCLSAKTTRSGSRAYNITQDGVVTEGVCAGHCGPTAGGGSGTPGSTAESRTAYNTPEQNGWTSVVYGNGRFVALATDGTNRVMTSTDGVTWIASAAANTAYYKGLTFGNGRFVAVAPYATQRVMTSAL